MIPYGKIDSMSALGHLVRQKRKEVGVRQADAAALSGVGARFLSELERGKERAEIGKVLQVLDRFGLEVWIVPRGWELSKAAVALREWENPETSDER